MVKGVGRCNPRGYPATVVACVAAAASFGVSP